MLLSPLMLIPLSPLYCGFDPTARSLQVGNLVSLMLLAHFRRHGHRPLALVGGATGLIGDPSGKSEERQLMTEEELEENVAGQSAQVDRVLDRALEMHPETLGETDAEAGGIPLLNNANWMSEQTFIGFLRQVGKHFRVNQMMNKESVRARLEDREQGISYAEFSYMVLQAYDFLHLRREHGCELQVGGSDQWGNITAGIDLIGRVLGEEAHGLTAPLVTDRSGKKLGKSLEGAVYLDPDMTSPYEFYQYWVRRDDAEVPQLLRMFTFLPREEIDPLLATLQRVKDTLSLLSLGGPSALLSEQLQQIQQWKERSDDLSSRDFMEVADALLYVESSLSALRHREVSPQDLEQASVLARKKIIASSHLAEAQRLVIHEAQAGIAMAKRAITSYVDSNFDSAHIANVAVTLRSVWGGLYVINLHRAAAVLQSSIAFIQSHVKGDGQAGAQRHQLLETLADAMISLEYYLSEYETSGESNEDILVVAEEGLIIDTILVSLAGLVEGAHPAVSANVMFAVQSTLNVLVPSGSGQAALTMPVMAPLADLVGVSRQTAVLAFQLGDGLTNIIVPASAALMGCLAAARLDWAVWVRFIWKPMLGLIALASAFVLIAQAIGYS